MVLGFTELPVQARPGFALPSTEADGRDLFISMRFTILRWPHRRQFATLVRILEDRARRISADWADSQTKSLGRTSWLSPPRILDFTPAYLLGVLGPMTPLNVITFLAATAVLGCASNPPVQPASSSTSRFDGAVYGGETAHLDKPTPGAEVYRAFYQGGSGFVSLSSVRGAVEDIATKHCARGGKTVRPLQETTSKPPYILGNFPRVEWLFECADRAGTIAAGGSTGIDKLGQIERLKRHLDSEALTQQEYEREKAKILGTQ